jgi:hypothetical protein
VVGNPPYSRLVRWLGTFAGLGDTPSGLPGSS